MRGGLEQLGANTDTLVQMQALSHNLAQHRTLNHVAADSQQPPSKEPPASLPSAYSSKGPRLPLRPKPHQTKQGSVTQSHTQHPPTPAVPQGAAASPKRSLHSNTHPGQENSFQPYHTRTAHSPQDLLSSAAQASNTFIAAQQAGEVGHSRTWHNQHLQSSAQQGTAEAGTAHAAASRDFSALAASGQLAAGLQQAVLGQPQAASDAMAEQHTPPLPVSYSNQSPNHLGESFAPGQACIWGRYTLLQVCNRSNVNTRACNVHANAQW